jgi:eukaryotic translation initiation factor 2C
MSLGSSGGEFPIVSPIPVASVDGKLIGLGIARKTFKILRVSDKNSRQYKFDLKERETGEIIPDVSVEEYFKRKYNLALQWPEFPVLETTKKGVVYPMECSIMLGGQRYPYKLTETQVCTILLYPGILLNMCDRPVT